jgi:hypothetical protein
LARLAVRPRPPEASEPSFEVRYEEVEVAGTLRRTLVTVPRTPGRHPAVLYLTGVGCFSQEVLDPDGSEAKLLHGLTRAGFVTMRVEKTGMGDSQGPPCAGPEADMTLEVLGYLAGLRALKRHPAVDAARVFLVGLSVGGVEAPQVARQEPVRGVVVVNTVARPFFEYLLATRRRQLALGGVPFDEIDRRMALQAACNHRFLVEREPLDELLRRDPACRDAVDYPAPPTFMQEWAALNVAAQWKQVDAPVLVVYGTADFVSSIEDDPYLVRMIDAFHPGRATLLSIPGMEHGMTRAASMEASYAARGGGIRVFEAAVLEEMLSWMRPLARGG